MSLPPEWPEGYEPTENEIRERAAQIKHELEEARSRVEDLERLDTEFFFAHGQKLPRPPRPEPRNELERFLRGWSDQLIEEQLKPLSLRFKTPPANADGTVTFKIMKAP